MLLGVHEQYHGDNATTHDGTSARYPRTVITREFKGGVIAPQNLVKPVTRLCAEAWAKGWVVNISLKLSVAEVFNGAWQIHIEQLARVITDNGRGGQTILTFWHEPENDTRSNFPVGSNKPGAFADAAEYVRYFNTIHGWVKGVNRNIVTSHAALGYAYRFARGGANDKTAWVETPSDWTTNADVHAIDIYSGRSFPLAETLPNSIAFKRWYGSRPVESAWGVSERGWTAPPAYSGDRARAVAAELAWLATLPTDDYTAPALYIVWLTEGAEKDINLKPDEAMTNAINTGFERIANPPEDDDVAPTPDPTPATIECPLCHGNGTVPPGEYAVTTTVTVSR